MRSMVEGACGRCNDARDDRRRVSHYIHCRHPEHPVPVFFDKGGPFSITDDGSRLIVHGTIDFYDEARRKAAEVRDIRTDRMLLAELQPRRFPPKVLPEQHFRIGHGPPQGTGKRDLGPHHSGHAPSTTALHAAVPLPLQGRIEHHATNRGCTTAPSLVSRTASPISSTRN